MKKKRLLVVLLCSLLGLFVVTGCSKSEAEDTKVSIAYGSSDLTGENYEEVVSKLKENGFENVEVEKIEDLIMGWLTKDGQVEEVKIGDTTSFSKEDKFEKDVAITISYHTFEEKTAATTDSSEITEPLFLEVESEVNASEDNLATITGTTVPNAEVLEGTGIFREKTTADDQGKFTLVKELSIPEETKITINVKANGEKKSAEIKITPNQKAVKKYEEEKEKERAAEEEKKKAAEAKEAEANKVISSDNDEEFKALLLSHDDFDAAKNFADKNKGRTIEFDGNIAYMSHHGNYDTRYDFLIYYGDYSEDGTGTSGPAFQFVDQNAVGDLNYVGENIPDSIGEGQNLHIKAKIVEYNDGGGLMILEPVETSFR